MKALENWTIHEWQSSITIRDGKHMVCRCSNNATGRKYAKFLKIMPEMYEAIKEVVTVLDDCRRGTDEGNIPPNILDRFDQATGKCRAALKKAPDYSGCVQPEPECRTQPALRPADGTQRRSVWHTPDEVPQIPAGKNRVRIVFISDDKGFRVLNSDSFCTFKWWHVETIENHMVKWMYFDDLEAL